MCYLEHISQKFKIKGIDIRARSSDRYINATKVCNSLGKPFNKWYRLKHVKKYFTNIDKMLGKAESLKIDYKQSWIHPYLIYELIFWLTKDINLSVEIYMSFNSIESIICI